MLKKPPIPLPKAAPLAVAAWRNIYTAVPSQDLYDDLVSPGREGVLRAVEAATAGIDHGQPGRCRVFQYGAVEETIACFDSRYFAESRFSPGTYGVFYGAFEEETSIVEIMARHQLRFAEVMKGAAEPVEVDRKMFHCRLASDAAVDVRPLLPANPDLLSVVSYELCWKLGVYAREAGIDLLVTGSARRPGGSCVAAFRPEAIREEAFRYYFKMIFRPGQETEVMKMTKMSL